MSDSNALILIPARMASTRLPGKPLADIGGLPMIVHVLRRAESAGIGPAVVATDSTEIASAVAAARGRAMLTRSDHPSGSDRIFEALELIDPQRRVAVVVNVQGDEPALDPADIRAAVDVLADGAADIGTLAAEIKTEEQRNDTNVVKAIGQPVAPRRLQARTFTRANATGPGPHYHHVGLYAYRRAALERFVKLPPSENEKRERLEQLRALDAGMRIDIAIVDGVPLGVDTPEDLAKARTLLGTAGKS